VWERVLDCAMGFFSAAEIQYCRKIADLWYPTAVEEILEDWEEM